MASSKASIDRISSPGTCSPRRERIVASHRDAFGADEIDEVAEGARIVEERVVDEAIEEIAGGRRAVDGAESRAAPRGRARSGRS